MIVVLLTLLSLIYVFYKDKRVALASIIYIFVVLVIHLFFYFEVNIFGLHYFISDERSYIDFENSRGISEAARGDRILWFYFHNIISYVLPADGLFNKLISLPFLPLVLLLISRFCNGKSLSLCLYLFCPYLLLLMQTALRDIAILFLILLIIHTWCSSRSKSLTMFTKLCGLLVLLFLLRPFAVFIVVFSLFLFEFLSKLTKKTTKEKISLIFYTLLLATLVCSLFYFLFQSRIDQYIRMLTYFSENGLLLDENKSGVKPGLTFQYFSYAIVRYILTPFPTSLLQRFLTEEVTQHGYLDDFIRFFNQLFFYFMLIWILFKSVIVKGKMFFNWNSSVWVLLIVTSLNSFVYALYYAGGGHSRIKILLFVLVFVIFTLLNTRKIKDVDSPYV